jgi:hypothetical protein
MRVKLAWPGEDGGARPPPFITFTITSKVAVYSTLQLSGQIHWPFFISCKDMYYVEQTNEAES